MLNDGLFKDSLLESSAVARKPKRWPMTLAFALEVITVSFLLLVPLMSTGVIPVLAHVPLIAPIHSVEVEQQQPASHPTQQSPAARPTQIVSVINNQHPLLPLGQSHTSIDPPTDTSPDIAVGSKPDVGSLIKCDHDCTAIARPAEPPKRVRFSHLSEASLLRKVDPVYPRTAIITHIYGAVQLHAIIAKDGSIQSLSVVSGHPILAQAALDAVRQWRYRPYLLNDEAVEVETFITVNFRTGSN